MLKLLGDLAKLHGPPGQENDVIEYVYRYWQEIGFDVKKDPKGNVVVEINGVDVSTDKPTIALLAHMDEVAMMVTAVEQNGLISIGGLGGIFPAKIGEGPVDILSPEGAIPGILSMQSIHADNVIGNNEYPYIKSMGWDSTRIFTGLSQRELKNAGIRPGTRVCVSRSRKELFDLGSFVGGYAFDDRAFLAVLLELSRLFREERNTKLHLCFAATVSEEVKGHGALFLTHHLKPTIAVALDVLPIGGEGGSPSLDSVPGAWVRDGQCLYDQGELNRINRCFERLKFEPRWVMAASGATDAGFAVANGHAAKAVGFGIPVANIHGFEIIHKEALDNLLNLVLTYLDILNNEIFEE